MSLFGTSPPDDSPSMHSSFAQTRQSIFDDGLSTQSNSNSLFDDGDDNTIGGKAEATDETPWGMPTPRKTTNKTELVKSLLPASDVPDSYTEAFDNVLGSQSEGHNGGHIGPTGLQRIFAAGRIDPEVQLKIMGIVAPGASGQDVALGRSEFNCLLALIGLAQQGEPLSLDSIDERRRSLPVPKLVGLQNDSGAHAFLRATHDLAVKPPQTPVTPTKTSKQSTTHIPTSAPRQDSMDYSDDPWKTPDASKGQKNSATAKTNGSSARPGLNGDLGSEAALPVRTTSTFTTASDASAGDTRHSTNGQSYEGTSAPTEGAWTGGFSDAPGGNDVPNPFAGSGAGGGDEQRPGAPRAATGRTIGSGRTGGAIEEKLTVTLLPEKEGVFLFQHHNYEVASSRRGSKVVRRYSDFVWLLDCLHKRYPFRILPLLPPKRVAVNGNHLSNDGGFIEKRRRGLVRFLNAMVRHPIIGQEQLVVMFLTVPAELAVWRKQASISVLDEFADRPLPAGLEESLSPRLEELFERTRSGIRRSAELYINICNIVDRLTKRSEGVAADHARIASSLETLTETTADTYATDTNEVPLLNDGMQAMGKHLKTAQSLLEDEAKAWDQGVLEDLKRQRDALVSVRDLFERRERLDKDNIPFLERRIQTNETKLAGLRGKPEGLVKPGEIEKVAEAIIKDKESIVNQHNRSIFVKEAIRDELSYFQSTQYHVTRWNQDWAQERVKYAELLSNNWRQLLDELEGMPTGE